MKEGLMMIMGAVLILNGWIVVGFIFQQGFYIKQTANLKKKVESLESRLLKLGKTEGIERGDAD